MTAPTAELSRLHGGLRLTSHKEQSTSNRIREAPVPDRLVMPIIQHAGDAANPVVRIGESVDRGQLIASGGGAVSASVHASSSGTIVAIEERPVPARYEREVLCIVIETDGEDRVAASCRPLAGSITESPAGLAKAIEAAGIVGLGGAAYPTASKLAGGVAAEVEALILNGVECEPYISCDDMLMREHACEIASGAALMLSVLGIDRCLMAVESDKPAAWQAMQTALAELEDTRIRLVQIPTVYPSGGEDQLVKLLTGREVPRGGLPGDVGCLVHNVATAHAIYRLVTTGEPLISRVVTVTGDGIARPGNYRVRFGTSIAELARAAGGYQEGTQYLVMGGPMTGISLPHDDMPVTKATNCLIFATSLPSGSAEPERACIRCGECARVCPVRLQPQQIHRHAEAVAASGLALFGLDDCIECGCCDLVCPSHIPLTAQFRQAKAAMRLREHERSKAERAKKRFEAREERIQSREAAVRATLDERKREAGADAIRDIIERQRKKDGGD